MKHVAEFQLLGAGFIVHNAEIPGAVGILVQVDPVHSAVKGDLVACLGGHRQSRGMSPFPDAVLKGGGEKSAVLNLLGQFQQQGGHPFSGSAQLHPQPCVVQAAFGQVLLQIQPDALLRQGLQLLRGQILPAPELFQHLAENFVDQIPPGKGVVAHLPPGVELQPLLAEKLEGAAVKVLHPAGAEEGSLPVKLFHQLPVQLPGGVFPPLPNLFQHGGVLPGPGEVLLQGFGEHVRLLSRRQQGEPRFLGLAEPGRLPPGQFLPAALGEQSGQLFQQRRGGNGASLQIPFRNRNPQPLFPAGEGLVGVKPAFLGAAQPVPGNGKLALGQKLLLFLPK